MAGLAYIGHRSTEWCPRCGTSLSQHELTQAGVYQDRADPSLYVRFPLIDRAGRVAGDLDDDAMDAAGERRRGRPSRRGVRAARERRVGRGQAATRTTRSSSASAAASSSAGATAGPFDDLPPGAPVEHRVIPWDDVTMDQGTGIVHIATGCGGEDFELGRVHGLPVLTPVDESGRFYDDYGWLHGLSTSEAADQIIGRLGEQGLLVEAGLYTHAYPHCWRCDTPLIFRISDDWFISVEEIRPKLLEENAKVQWVPEYMGKRMDDWLRNMGDWNISRRRYYGLPLPFYPCSCGHLNVVGSKAELRRARDRGDGAARGAAPAVDRPRADPVRGSAESASTRIPEVGDVWLDAGIVPFATLGWENPSGSPRATGPARRRG